MTDPTLPSRARARELADCEADLAAYKPDNLPLNVTEWTEDFNASKDAAAEARDRAAILAAYASGVLVPAGKVAAMRERAAAICDDEVGVKPSPYYETSRAQEALEAAAARIRALPLEVPHD